MNESRKCRSCGAALPESAPEGLCPACLMAEAMRPTADLPPVRAPDIEEVRAAFPHLEILSLIGCGGMGAVFEARQPQLDRIVALKLLAPSRIDDPRFAERFQREARALAALAHPNIVTIHDFGEAGGFFYLLMEFVDGVNLRQALQAERFTPEQALAIVPQLCDALQFAHDRGIVHRDIKPENLLLDRDGRIKIADFGIARMLRGGGAPGDAGDTAAIEATLAAGTPGYMAPEQADYRARIDNRADIYSLGVVIYEMLTGEIPRVPIEPPSTKVAVDVRLDEVVLRALETTPELRFKTADELKTEVEAITATPAPAPASPDRRHDRAGRFGVIGLILCAAMVVLPVALHLLLSGIQGHLKWLALFALLGISGALGIAALVFGILGWRSPAGKAAVVVSILLPLLAVPATLVGYWALARGDRHAEAMQLRQEQADLLNQTLEARNRLESAAGADPEVGVRSPDAAAAANRAVETVSRCTEGDPRVAEAIKSLSGHDPAAVVGTLATHLDSTRANERRAAIHLLQHGGWNHQALERAIPDLTGLLDHREDLTRGMAALCLGEIKATAASERIIGMTRTDSSAYARRCAAYALGLLGDPAARPALEHALADPDPAVARNARAALEMLPGGPAAAEDTNTGDAEGAGTRIRNATDRVIVEDLALRLLAAIRDKQDDVLRELSVDRIDGWRDALPRFAFELRERLRHLTGEPFDLFPSDSIVAGDRAVVRCIGPDELKGAYLVLAFIRTEDGWRNWNLRNSPPNRPLQRHLEAFDEELARVDAGNAGTPETE